MHIDEFESLFKRAERTPYQFEAIDLGCVTFVSDKTSDHLSKEADAVRELFARGLAGNDESQKFEVIGGDDFNSVVDLLALIEKYKPDLIITERDLKTKGENLVYGLTNYVDALTQVCSSPVLLLPSAGKRIHERSQALNRIMVETDHLDGDSTLVNWGVYFAAPSGDLFLTHIEDDRPFAHYMNLISRIPDIDTDLAFEKIKELLIKVPRDFIATVSNRLGEEFPHLGVHGIVELGHALSVYQNQVDSYRIDLLAIHTKVEGQLAMSGTSYAMAVELKALPLLML